MANVNNNKRIENKVDYDKEFGLTRVTSQETDKQREEKQRKLLEYALDFRKFEIQLYWDRTKYFTSLITGSFGSYALFVSKIFEINEQVRAYILLLLTFLGFILSLAWYLSNKGSKYWQENWERHVDALEDEIIGPLYTTILNFDKQNICSPLDYYPFSVSKINQILSFTITLIWSVLFVVAFQEIAFRIEFIVERISLYIDNKPCVIIFPILILFLSSVIFMYFTKGKSEDPKKREIDFVAVK